MRYKSIFAKIQRTNKMWKAEKMNDLEELEGKDRLAVLKKKCVSVNSRGRKSIELGSRTEKILLA
jgi:hypothetical protein